MSDDGQVKMAARAEDPDHPVQRAKKAQLDVYRLGMLHAAFLLRGSDCQEASNEAMDACARLIEFDVQQCFGIRDWKVDLP